MNQASFSVKSDTSSSDTSSLRVIGIDPGLRITGFGLVEAHKNNLVYLASGCIRTNEHASLPERLGVIYQGINKIVIHHSPTEAAIEQVFVNINPQSTLLLGQARGAAICALVAAELIVSEYTALQIKKALVGKGRAAKEQVQHMVRYLLNLSANPGADAADALACAICHIHSKRQRALLAAYNQRVNKSL